MAVGLANHLLTLCERAPGLVLPIVVTEILSPEATAVWYIVWMSAWVVFTAPISMGIAQFAESARRPEKASATTAAAIKASLIYAGGGAAILAILAPLSFAYWARNTLRPVLFLCVSCSSVSYRSR